MRLPGENIKRLRFSTAHSIFLVALNVGLNDISRTNSRIIIQPRKNPVEALRTE